jgi:4-carboxymuconolactone decarboxylase
MDLTKEPQLDNDTYRKGLDIRKAVLGENYVADALSEADDFSQPLQQLVTEYCWGTVWARPGLSRKTRSMLNIAMLSVLNQPRQLHTHIRGALTNGVTAEEVQEILLQVAIYAGVPISTNAFAVAREALTEPHEG